MKFHRVALAAAGIALAAWVAVAIDSGAAAATTGATADAASGPPQLAKIVPGRSTKADVRALLGTPWRMVQFNDCGMAMDDQADETWEYRGQVAAGGYRVHVEFADNGVVHLIALIPDGIGDGKGVAARVAPGGTANASPM